MNSIENIIKNNSDKLLDPKVNFELACEYDNINQTASAISFYLRAAEYGYDKDPIIVYSSLLKISECFERQGGRESSLKNSLLQAIEYMPDRPEAYFLLSRFYERSQKWQKCYTWAAVGMSLKTRQTPLPVNVGFHGEYVLMFEKAVSGWWLGKKEESKLLFNQILSLDISQEYRSSIEYNLSVIG
jgi:tetratricopeptide (TPR) repeat protein